MLQEIKTLVQTLNEQRDAYYNKDSPKMTDKEYDRLFDRLEELEKKSGIIFSNSPTQSVGYYPVSELAKVRHTRALLSLEKTKQIRELADFMENQDTLLMLKLDGLTVKLVYEEGRLVQASTRGDGNVGEDITHNIPAFENVPLSISYRERLVTTGEAFIYKDDFRQLKDTIRDGNGEPYKNARNLASGSVRNLNPEVCKGRHVHFIPFNVLEGMDEGTIICRAGILLISNSYRRFLWRHLFPIPRTCCSWNMESRWQKRLQSGGSNGILRIFRSSEFYSVVCGMNSGKF